MKKKLLFLTAFSFYQTIWSSVCIVIDQPGDYEYGSGMLGNPTIPDDALFCIQSSNVTLGFNGVEMGQDPTNTMTGFVIVRIAQDLENIVIKSGIITNATGAGITADQGCKNIKIEDIDVKNCANGIVFSGALADPIDDSIIQNCSIVGSSGAQGGPAYGVRLINCNHIRLINCAADENDAGTNNSGFGFDLEFCNAYRINDCQATNNGGNILGVGINLYQSTWGIIKNCVTINNAARSNTAGSEAVGIRLDTSSHVSILDCESTGNNHANTDAFGFKAKDGQNNIFSNCIATNNFGNNRAAGFIFEGVETKSSITNSKARLSDGLSAGTGYGILLNGATHCDILSNVLLGNKGNSGFGLADTTTNTTNLIASNLAFANTTNGFSVNRTVGTFPCVTASVGDFTPTLTVNSFYNINFVD